MSSKIIFNINGVNSSVSGLSHTISRLQSIQNNVAGVRNSVDPRILARSGINGRFSRAASSFDRIEMKMNQLKAFTANSAERYANSDQRVNRQADAVNKAINAARKQIDERFASNLYETYNNTYGRWVDFLHGAQYAAGAGFMHLLGFRFTDIDGVLRKFQVVDDVLLGKMRLPVASMINKIESSRMNMLARLMVSPTRAFSKKTLSELIYKRAANYFPKDIAGLSNSVQKLLVDAKNGPILNAVKNHSGSILKNGLRLGKSNAALAVLITAGAETIGAGIKITENYNMYSGEKLKEENAKVVGSAVYKTAVVSGTSVAGAVVGGMLGSIVGPVGTVAGAAVGGFVGSWVGDKIANKTPAWVDKTALHFKDGIHKGTEAIAFGVSKVKEGFNDVKAHASNLLGGAKSIIGFGG
ncbi:glycine zipper domain-containing protein [Mesobacillus subterraneus]|uniref:glycine zipper domain-containing protein n=1 Tax=Mesobacillus subterraneus TaxID=285983 RepID=UPI002041A621|nr:glycine zipper domain-containing protein [Mesobacillus subterraneus]MCM3666087.1 glycine zipper domain-containing protein [Mesobacillus subterraneus]MCM3685085.1 glycine zipper domain-containing protein [Mesobacillus subterraneus]